MGTIRRINKITIQKEGGDTLFGEGQDGAVTITNGVTTYLVRDMYYSSLTVDSGGILFTNGFRVFVNGTLTNNGTIGMPSGLAATVSDGSGTLAGRTTTTTPTNSWGNSNSTIAPTAVYDFDVSLNGFTITSGGTISKITGGKRGTTGSSGSVTSAGVGSYPPASTGQAGGAGNPATAGTGGIGGDGGGLVVIFAKTIAGSGTIVSQGRNGLSGNASTNGNPAPTIPAGHNSGNYPHPGNGTRVSPSNATAHPASHNAGAHPHPAGSTPHPAGSTGTAPHTGNPHPSGHNSGDFHHPANSIVAYAPHNSSAHPSGHNSGHGYHHHPAGSTHGSHPANGHRGFTNHNGNANPSKNHNAGHGFHPHPSGQPHAAHPAGGPHTVRSHHNGSFHPSGHNSGNHHHPAGSFHRGNVALGNHQATAHPSGHNAGAHPHPAGSTPHPAGSTGTAPHTGNPHPSGHNSGTHPHPAAVISVTTAPYITSNLGPVPSHNATSTPSYPGGAGGTANPGATGDSGETGGIIVVARNAGNAAAQLGHSNFSKVIDI